MAKTHEPKRTPVWSDDPQWSRMVERGRYRRQPFGNRELTAAQAAVMRDAPRRSPKSKLAPFGSLPRAERITRPAPFAG
jgi:hypothetical protein